MSAAAGDQSRPLRARPRGRAGAAGLGTGSDLLRTHDMACSFRRDAFLLTSVGGPAFEGRPPCPAGSRAPGSQQVWSGGR